MRRASKLLKVFVVLVFSLLMICGVEGFVLACPSMKLSSQMGSHLGLSRVSRRSIFAGATALLSLTHLPRRLFAIEDVVDDRAHMLSRSQHDQLRKEIQALERAQGMKVRLSTKPYRAGESNSPTDGLFKAANDTILVLATSTPKGANPPQSFLSFNVGSDVLTIAPVIFFIRLQNKMGNPFYVRKRGGESVALMDAIKMITDCSTTGMCDTVDIEELLKSSSGRD